MPLVALALLAYLAGLFSGFAGSLLLRGVAIAAAALLGARRGQVVSVAFAGLALAGSIIASAAAQSDAQCAVAAAHASALTVVLADSAGPGAYVTGALTACTGVASLSVEEGHAPAGATVRARGDISASRRGVVVQHAVIVVLKPPPVSARLRAAAGRAIDRTFRGDAPLVRALLIADKHELTPALRDSFATAGLAHLLAIAGLHIGILAAALTLTLEACGVSRWRAAPTTMVVVVGYVIMIGAPIPAVRSAVMLMAFVGSRLAQRPTARWAIVAIGAAQPVVDPRIVLEVGYQLSVVGVSAMIAAATLCTRLGVKRKPEPAQGAITIVVTTTIVTIATAPIVAWVFGQVSLIAPLSNLAAVPLMALAQPMLACGLVLSPMPAFASIFADAVHPLLAGLTFIATTSASIPNASLSVSPTIPAAVLAGVVSVGLIVACVARDWSGPATIASLATVALIWMPLAPRPAGMVELHMIDVGQGDAIALRTPHGYWVLFDAGREWPGGDSGRSTIIPYLGRRGGTLESFVLSHPHTDHVGGAASVLRALHPLSYIDAAFAGPAGAYRESLEAARASRVRWMRAHPGDSLVVDGVSITFLAPDSAWTAALVDPNLASVVALIHVGKVRMLLMGDAERPEEDWLLRHCPDSLHADILKVGHHGSSTSSSAEFLRAVRPRLALVSVGAGNSYHLPSPSVIHALGAWGAQVLRTDQVGTVVARTDGERIFVDAAGDSWELPPASDR